MGRSWGYHECALLLTLILGLVLHYGETPTDALRVASTIMRRSYNNLHTLWTKWRSERLVCTVQSTGRGAGAVSHIDHAHHVPVEVIFLIIEYIRYTHAAGTGCTSTELQRCILAEQRLSIVDKLFTAHGHELIYTPPYLPGVQPIERLWAYVQNHVAAQYRRGRTVPELVSQTYQGFYGDDQQHAGVDAALCARVIEHSHSFCNHLIEQDDALSGIIDSLSTESTAVQVYRSQRYYLHSSHSYLATSVLSPFHPALTFRPSSSSSLPHHLSFLSRSPLDAAARPRVEQQQQRHSPQPRVSAEAGAGC